MKQVLVMLATLAYSGVACGGSDEADRSADANTQPGMSPDAAPSGDSAQAEDLDMQAADFGCILDGTKTKKFYIRNLLGHLDEAVDVASSPTGGTYPVGTVLQLVPQEAMVKRARGWNATTNDWEFFFLGVSGTTTTISTRGAQDTTNAFGGNCFDCHSKAAPQWDLVCETTHGCDPLQISDQSITNLQNSDSRCN